MVKMVGYNLPMSDDMKSAIAALAKSHDRTTTEEIRIAITHWLAQCGKPFHEDRPGQATTRRDAA